MTHLKYTLLALGSAALFAGCVNDDGIGENDVLDEPTIGDEGAFENEGIVNDERPGALEDDRNVRDTDVALGNDAADTGADGAVAAYPAFEDLDADGDGALTRAELGALEGVDFATLDADRNGSVTAVEYVAGLQE